MLHALRQYATQEKLIVAPGFKPKLVRWLLIFSPQGKFLGVQDLTGGDKKSKGREFPACPDLTQQEMVGIGNGCRHFLVDGLDVVCLLTKDGNVDDKLAAKHEFFVSLLDEAKESLPPLEPISLTLRTEKSLAEIRVKLTDGKAKPTDPATLAVMDKAGPSIFVDGCAWHDWWRRKRGQMAAARQSKASAGRKKAVDTRSTARMLCLMSGELVEPLPTHNKIERLSDVGGLAMGDSLVSFDKDAFTSYGLEQGANAAMSESMVKTYVTALNHLIRSKSRRLAGVKVVYWYSGRLEPKDDPLPDLFDGLGPAAADAAEKATQPSAAIAEASQAQGAAARLLDAIRSGERPDLADYRYYALTLSANSGRVVIRDWTEGQFTDLLEAVNAWFDDLAITLLDSTRAARPPSFEHVLTSGLRERPQGQAYDDWAKPTSSVRTPLWKAALGGERVAIPRALIEQVANSHTATLLSRHSIVCTRIRPDIGATSDTGKNYRTSLLYTRLGTMRAYCNRYARLTQQGDFHVATALNVNHPRAAYHVGRLMAVLEMIQSLAQGELGATIAQTHYAAAATRPIAALPRLQTLAQHHIPKIEPYLLRQEFLRLLTEINLAIGSTLPRTFDLEDQCLFHLGYYHQRAYQPYDEPARRHWTAQGAKVRSKSEVIVANLLTQLGIEYEYETPLQLKADSTVRGFKRIDNETVEIRPDFTVRRSKDERPVFIEHLGMMDNFAYRNNWDDRKLLYASNGIFLANEGQGTAGTLVTTQEEKGSIDCRQLIETLKQVL